jgi:hypothetical protein
LITKLCVFGMVTTACRPGYSHFGLQNLTFDLNMDEGAYTVQLCLVCNFNLHSIMILTMYNTCLWSLFNFFCLHMMYCGLYFWPIFPKFSKKKFFFHFHPRTFFCVLLQPFWTWWHHKTFCCCHFDVRAQVLLYYTVARLLSNEYVWEWIKSCLLLRNHHVSILLISFIDLLLVVVTYLSDVKVKLSLNAMAACRLKVRMLPLCGWLEAVSDLECDSVGWRWSNFISDSDSNE